MPTFLTTPRMNPALRARVERSVSNRTRARHNAGETGLGAAFKGPRRRGSTFARVLPLVTIGILALVLGLVRRRDQRELEEARADLLTTLTAEQAILPPQSGNFLASTAQKIADEASLTYAGDVVAPELLAHGELDAWLARPTVYLRGATPELRDPARFAAAAATSIKDAFLMCLIDPPVSRRERDVMAKIKGVYFAGAMVDDETVNVRLMIEAQKGLAVFTPAFEAEARAADDIAIVKRLRRTLEAAPVAGASLATSAELLVLVADEIQEPDAAAKPALGISPLGYRAQEVAHDARVTLLDLTSGKVLLRVRRRVDAGGRSERATALYRVAIQGCDLALDVREATEH